MTDLKLCPHPFVDHRAFQDIEICKQPRSFGGYWWRVRCRNCGLETPVDETEAGAIARWNDAPRKKQMQPSSD